MKKSIIVLLVAFSVIGMTQVASAVGSVPTARQADAVNAKARALKVAKEAAAKAINEGKSNKEALRISRQAMARFTSRLSPIDVKEILKEVGVVLDMPTDDVDPIVEESGEQQDDADVVVDPIVIDIP